MLRLLCELFVKTSGTAVTNAGQPQPQPQPQPAATAAAGVQNFSQLKEYPSIVD